MIMMYRRKDICTRPISRATPAVDCADSAPSLRRAEHSHDRLSGPLGHTTRTCVRSGTSSGTRHVLNGDRHPKLTDPRGQQNVRTSLDPEALPMSLQPNICGTQCLAASAHSRQALNMTSIFADCRRHPAGRRPQQNGRCYSAANIGRGYGDRESPFAIQML